MSRVRSWKVLRGGMDTLIRHRPRLQLEIQPTHIAKYGACAHDVVNLLVDLDYTMPARRDGAWRPRSGHQRRSYLFVP